MLESTPAPSPGDRIEHDRLGRGRVVDRSSGVLTIWLDVPGRPGVIRTSGHSRGECVLHLEQRDALVTLDIAPAHVGPSLLTPPFVLALAQARASLQRIEATGAGIMLPGHGEPWRTGS